MSLESHNLEVTDTLDENLQFWHEEEDSSFLDLNFKHDKWDTYLGEMSKLLTTTAFRSGGIRTHRDSSEQKSII